MSAGGAAPAALRVRGLSFSYPDGSSALSDVDLEVREGERVALLGPNGAGKTTFVLHLNGVLRPDQGTVSVGDLVVAKENLGEVRRRVGLVFQDPDDQLFMPTVAEDVAFGPANFGLSGRRLRDRVDAALADVDMTEYAERSPMHLSYGQRRRVALAAVLACDPDILVLDEPSSNLDPVARRELAEVLFRLQRTILMVTHDLPYALQLCPRGVILDGGRIVADAPTRELLADADRLARHRLELPYGFAVT